MQTMKKPERKAAIFIADPPKTPPMSANARRMAGLLVAQLQEGKTLSMPTARPMTSIGKRCLELRITDEKVTWRVMCRTDPDAVVVLYWFAKKTAATPKNVIDICQKRLAAYENLKREVKQ